MSRYAIECAGIEKTFFQRTIPVTRLQDRLLQFGRIGKKVRIEALKPTTVSVEHGEWVGLYGPNGSGKTTFMKILAGLLRADRGSVKRNGVVSSFFELGIGFHPERAAHENIRLNGLLHGLSSKQIAVMTERILDFAAIGEFANLPLKCYSAGMKMRLAFAVSAFIDADIYLFDEVLAVGDVSFRQRCEDYFSGLKKKGKTVIIVAHDFHELCKLSHRVLFFDTGRVTGQRKKIRWSESPEPELVWKIPDFQRKLEASV